MNSVRWNSFGTTDTAAIVNNQNALVKVIYDYVDIRYPFLSDVYSNDTYFVKYDIGAYGKKLVHDTNIYKSGDNATVLVAPDSTDNKMLFVCWSTKPDGSGDSYNAGDKITVTDNTVLYAQWGKKSVLELFFQSIAEFFQSIMDFFLNIFK